MSQLCAKTTKIQPIFLRPQRQESYKAWASRCTSTRYIIDALTNASQSAYKHGKEIYGKRKLWPTSQKETVDNMFAFWVFDWWGCAHLAKRVIVSKHLFQILVSRDTFSVAAFVLFCYLVNIERRATFTLIISLRVLN